MAPPSADTYTEQSSSAPTLSKTRAIPEIKKSVAGLTQSASFATPLQYSGSLDTYESFDVTNVIGREFPKLQLTDILKDDEKIRDLAILETSKLHKHALSNSKRGIAVDENGKLDDEVSVISSEVGAYLIFAYSDPVLTFGSKTPNFNRVAAEHGLELLDQDRGAPENTGTDFTASHPVVRTNPVTGWKSLFGAGHQVHAGWIDNVTETESEVIKAYFLKIIAENHDLQVRFKWRKNDLAIWDNRSVFHTATNDYEGIRQGNRVVSLGEKPFYNPASKCRREALYGGLQGQ
ncbi:hypothetical protein ONS95_013720 [Cadophora gregata]|uniref:uncharacterized protein n=1 Tax=Cadophora gregata TaxID=51156 RepID=UPI0026DA861B|nr:uncharacterized protein ONS95_013720 [Cadophora gregata]KAK0113462.1 hypothetical protein ONS96_014328 [Cadophora gregata f. sp. sojae]KAK0114221.1 hypothetical protein ONS95_013720 [Cadophora gregata]